jgi:hypothetical protein
MVGMSRLRRARRAAMIGSIALAIGLMEMHPSFAGCGGYCEARQARDICHSAVEAQGLKGHERDHEFVQCKTDPISYLELEELADAMEMDLE